MPVTDLSIEKIDPSPLNPRKTYDETALQELADDIKLRGVLQNILVRPKDDGRFELVVGERRYRASKMAGRDTIPGAIVELDDRQALETMIVENAKRADVDPVDEADAYRALLETHHLTVEEIADRVGRSRSAVYARLKLCELCQAGRVALQKGRLTPSTALLVARIPSEKLQKAAVKEISGGRYADDEPMSARRAQDHIQRNFMLRLADAPWKIHDVELLPAAGACAVCPKRTGNQAELFSDVKSADVCTDPTCFDLKKKAHGKRRQAEAKKAGATILPAAQAKKVLQKPYRKGVAVGLQYGAPFVSLDERCYDDPKGRTYRQLLKPQLEEITIASGHGDVLELVPKKGLPKRLKDAGHDLSSSRSPAAQRMTPAQKKSRERQKANDAFEDETDRRCLEKIFEHERREHPLRLRQGVDDLRLVRFWADYFAARLWANAETICSVLGVTAKKHRHVDELEKWVRDEKRTSGELAGLLSMIAAIDGSMSQAEKLCHFDRKAIAKAVRDDAKALAAAKPKRKKAAKKRAAKKAAKRKAVKA